MLRERLAEGDIGQVRIRLTMSGGMPGERRSYREIGLAGDGRAQVRVTEAGGDADEASLVLDEAQTFELLRKLGDSADDFVTRAEARFLPDSVVGVINISVGDGETALYFLVSEDDRETQRQRLSPHSSELVSDMSRLIRRAVGEGGSPS